MSPSELQSDNKFLSVFENSLSAIILGKPDGLILEANNAALEMFGYNLDEMKAIGRSVIFDHLDPGMISALEKRRKDGSVKGVIIGIRKNGERFPCEFTSVIFKAETGEDRTSTVLNDITQRRKTENEIALLLSNTEESFILLDKSLHIISFNKSYGDRYKLLLNKEVKKGDCIFDYVQPERRLLVEDIYKRVFKGETIKDEIRIFSQNKGVFIFSSYYKPACDHKGNIIGAFITIRDVTEKKLAQQQIVANEKRFTAIIEHTNDLILLTDINRNIIYASPSSEKILGVKNEDIINKPYQLLIHDDYKEDSKRVFEELINKPGIPIARLMKVLHRDGHFIWVEGIVTNLLDDDNVKAIVSNFRDISERIRNHELKEFERRDKEALINSTDDLIWSVSKDFKLIAGNKAFIDLIKIHTGFILTPGDNILLDEFYDKDALFLWKEMYERALTGEGFKKEIFSIIGERRTWSETSFNPMFCGNSVEGVACYLRDITERKLSDEKIKEAKERYDIIAKATNDTILDVDLIKKTVTWSDGIYGTYGFTQQEPGINTYEWRFSKIHDADREKVKKSLEASVQKNESRWEIEYRFICADQSFKFVSERGFLVLNDAGEPIRMMGSMQDITTKKKEEHRLKLLESVITNTRDSVMITEAEPFDEPGPKIVYVNEAFSIMTGYEASEVIGKSPRILQGLNTNREELNRLRESMSKWQSCEVTVINYKKNGEEFWINFSVTPVADEKGWYTHWIAIERDVTHIKQNELEREQIISELSQINTDLKQFSYVTSHNLRAPIANLLGLTSLIEQYKIADKTLVQILDGVRQAALMFDDTVKDLTKVLIIKDQKNIIKEQIYFDIVVGKVMKQLNIISEGTDLSVNCDFKNCLSVSFTHAYLESILLNLFTNAIKYKSASRKLKIEVISMDTDDFVEMRFSDNGIGIDTEMHKDKLFKLYQRFHNKADGKGLGLYLIKSQLEALGGTIEVDSKVDVGTTFIVKFKK